MYVYIFLILINPDSSLHIRMYECMYVYMYVYMYSGDEHLNECHIEGLYANELVVDKEKAKGHETAQSLDDLAKKLVEKEVRGRRSLTTSRICLRSGASSSCRSRGLALPALASVGIQIVQEGYEQHLEVVLTNSRLFHGRKRALRRLRVCLP